MKGCTPVAHSVISAQVKQANQPHTHTHTLGVRAAAWSTAWLIHLHNKADSIPPPCVFVFVRIPVKSPRWRAAMDRGPLLFSRIHDRRFILKRAM